MPLDERRARICCLDLDTFFVSVERHLDPSLEGKQVIIGGLPGERGVVTACSYEVRTLGVHSGMSLTAAAKLAPRAIYLRGRHGTYGEYSQRAWDVVARYAPDFRIASIDELYMDLRGCERMYRRPEDDDDDATMVRVVRAITAAIRAEVGLPASVGVAASKVVAKVASGLAKPAGVVLVPAGSELEVLSPLPVRKFPGIGPVAASKLGALGIATLGDLVGAARTPLRGVLGAWTEQIRAGICGMGSAELGRDRPAFREHDPRHEVVGSISNERTFREDVGDESCIESMLCSLCERVCWRARKRGVQARTVTLKLRYADFETLTRSHTMRPTDSEVEVYAAIKTLYGRARTRRTPIRLLGVALSKLGLFEQLSLFDGDQRLHGAVDAIRERYGYDSVRIATGR
jgi:DNA polymerase-4